MSQQVAEFMLRKKNLPVHQKEKFLQTHDQESLNFIMPPKRKNVFFHFIGSLSSYTVVLILYTLSHRSTLVLSTLYKPSHVNALTLIYTRTPQGS